MQIDFALSQLEKAQSDVFKIAGPIMIKTDKVSLKKELSEQLDLIKINLKKTEDQEKKIEERLQTTQTKLQKMLGSAPQTKHDHKDEPDYEA